MPAIHGARDTAEFNAGRRQEPWKKVRHLKLRKIGLNGRPNLNGFALVGANFVGKKQIKSTDCKAQLNGNRNDLLGGCG